MNDLPIKTHIVLHKVGETQTNKTSKLSSKTPYSVHIKWSIALRHVTRVITSADFVYIYHASVIMII